MPNYTSDKTKRIKYNNQLVSKIIYNSINAWEDTYYPTKGLEYTLSADETYYIFSGFGTANTKTLVAIAPYINGKPVKEINDTISDTVETIFIPNTITKILASGLRGLASLETIIFEKNSLLVETKSYALADNPLLKNVILPEGLTTIGSTFCYNCPELETINIPSTVNYIGSYAFGNCPKLTRVDCYPIIPPSLPQPPDKLPFRLLSGLLGFKGKIYVPNELVSNYVYYSDWSQIASPTGVTDSYIYPMTDAGWTNLFEGNYRCGGDYPQYLKLPVGIQQSYFNQLWFRITFSEVGSGLPMQAIGKNGEIRYIIDGFFENWYIGCSIISNYLIFNSISYWKDNIQTLKTIDIKKIEVLMDGTMTEAIVTPTITLNTTYLDVFANRSYQLTATVIPAGIPPLWKSNAEASGITVKQNGLVSTGKIVTDISNAISVSIDDVIAYCSVNVKGYTVSFETYGGNSIAPLNNQTRFYFSDLPTPVKDNLSFLGWYFDSEFISPVEYNNVLTNNVTLHAKWEVSNGKVLYHNEDGLMLVPDEYNEIMLKNPFEFDWDFGITLGFLFIDPKFETIIVSDWQFDGEYFTGEILHDDLVGSVMINPYFPNTILIMLDSKKGPLFEIQQH